MSASFPLAKANTSHSDTYIHSFTVYSNHDRPQDNHVRRFLQRHGIPYHYLPTAHGNKREQEILELIQGTDFVVLARYMQVKSAPSFFFPPFSSFFPFSSVIRSRVAAHFSVTPGPMSIVIDFDSYTWIDYQLPPDLHI